MKIGFIGLGNVGGKLAGSLFRNKFDLTVFDLDKSVADEFKSKGVKVANSVGDPNILKGFSVDGRVETSLGTFVTAYNGALDVSIRPECIELLLDSEGSYVVKECTFYGHDQVISFQNSKGEVFRARSLPNTIYEAGDKVNINISEVTTFPSN